MIASQRTTIGLMLSGGLDSCILLGTLLAEGLAVQPFYVRSQLVWQAAEQPALERYLAAMAQPRLQPLVLLELPLADVYGQHWSTTGQATPDETTPDDAVYLPGRNPLLLIKAAVWCALHGVGQLAVGTLAGNPFSDATDAFFADFQAALNRALSAPLELVRPFSRFDKQHVMRLGRDAPLEHTFSCVSPVGMLHCGHCNKCCERKQAFSQAAIADATRYATAGSGGTNGQGAHSNGADLIRNRHSFS